MNQQDLEFLTSESGQALLTLLQNEDLSERNTLKLITRLRDHYTREQSAAGLTLARLREKAADKFGEDARRLFFTEDALQQASDPLIRRYRAEDSAGLRILDVGCGVGSDSIAFARAGADVHGIDLDPLRVAMARQNARALGLEIDFTVTDAREIEPAGYDLIFYDPARRDEQGRRIYDVEQYIPPLSLVNQWQGKIMVKLSPGVDLSQLEGYGGSVEFISVAGDLKEAVLLLGAQPGLKSTLLTESGRYYWQRQGAEPAVPIKAPDGWLIEPDPAILRAGLVRDVAAHFEGAMLDETIAYFTTDALPVSEWVRGWRVRDWLPFNLKALRAALRERNIGYITVKKRGSPLTPEELIPKLKLKGDDSCTLVLTRYENQHIVIICDDILIR